MPVEEYVNGRVADRVVRCAFAGAEKVHEWYSELPGGYVVLSQGL